MLAAADAAEADKTVGEGSPLWRRRVIAVAGLVLLPIWRGHAVSDAPVRPTCPASRWRRG
ncbi:MAG: hypothetical protein WDN48_19365 [Pseudolabrys sp.]